MTMFITAYITCSGRPQIGFDADIIMTHTVSYFKIKFPCFSFAKQLQKVYQPSKASFLMAELRTNIGTETPVQLWSHVCPATSKLYVLCGHFWGYLARHCTSPQHRRTMYR